MALRMLLCSDITSLCAQAEKNEGTKQKSEKK